VNYSRKYLEGTQKMAMLLAPEKIETMVSIAANPRVASGGF
jgi:hypothetical protein